MNNEFLKIAFDTVTSTNEFLERAYNGRTKNEISEEEMRQIINDLAAHLFTMEN